MQELGAVGEEWQKFPALSDHVQSAQFTRSLDVGLPCMSGLFLDH